jgi:hypothetical protein
LFIFIYVNDEWIHGGLVFRSESIRRFSTRENDYKGATMKKIAIYAGLFAFLVSPLAVRTTSAAQSGKTSDANPITVTGHVSCAKFGTGSVTARKGMSVAQTIQYCVVFQHSEYTLVSGNHIFKLEGDNNLLAKMSGKTVTVAGHVSPDTTDVAAYALMGTVAVDSVVPTKE